jgi:uncharacterized membrane protein
MGEEINGTAAEAQETSDARAAGNVTEAQMASDVRAANVTEEQKKLPIVVQLPQKRTERIFELDFLRGLLIIFLIWEHFYSSWNYYFITLHWNNYGFFNAIHSVVGSNLITNIMQGWYPYNDFGLYCFFIMQGITLTFSRHNKRRATGLLIGFLIYFALFVLDMTVSKVRFFSYLNYDVFLGYAACMFIFILVSKFSFNIQLWIMALLSLLSLSSIISGINFPWNPFHWFGLVDKIVLQRDQNEYAYKVLVFPLIFIFSLGTIIGQVYYKNRRSPFKKGYNLYKKKIFKPVLWCGRYSIRIFLVQMISLPAMFFILSLIF